MATYVLLVKELENEEYVIYKFGSDSDNMGLVKFNKLTEEYFEIEPVPNTDSTFYFNKAVSKLLKHFKSGEAFPDRTQFAS